jgi:hypothetical protein
MTSGHLSNVPDCLCSPKRHGAPASILRGLDRTAGIGQEIARPATNGARTIRLHSSSVKSLLVVTAGPFVRKLGGWAARGRPRALCQPPASRRTLPRSAWHGRNDDHAADRRAAQGICHVREDERILGR